MADARSAALPAAACAEEAAALMEEARRHMDRLRRLSETPALPGGLATLGADLDRAAGSLRASKLRLLDLAYRLLYERRPDIALVRRVVMVVYEAERWDRVLDPDGPDGDDGERSLAAA